MIRSRRWLWLWAVPGLFLLIFFFLPLGAVFRTAGTAALLEGLRPSFGKQLVRALGFTFGQAALSTIFTLILGLPAAYLFARFRFPGKRLMQVLTTLPFILPTVVVAAGFNALLGPSGWLNWGLMRIFGLESAPIQVMNTLGAILLAHVFYNTGVIIRVVGSAWAQLDPRLELAGRVLGASTWQTLKQITLPLLKPSILAGTLLVFIFDFTSFGVILLLGGPAFATLEVEIYIQAMQMLNMPAAGVLSAVQLACTLGLTIIYSRLAGRRNIPLNPRLNVQGLYRLDTPKRKVLAGVVLTGLAALLVLPQLALILRSLTVVDLNSGQMHMTLDYYKELFINRRQSLFYVPPIQAAVNSFLFAGVTVIISLLLGLMAAYALRVRSRLNRLLDPLLMLPLGTSAVTLGLGFILVFNQPPLDARTFPLLIPLAHSLVALPFVIRTLQPALASIPPSLPQAAAVLGANPWHTWWEVERPIIARAGMVSAIFAFTISLGEFGATTFLARPETPTLPVAIFRFIGQPGQLNYGQALAMSTILLVVCAVSILLLERIQTGEDKLF